MSPWFAGPAVVALRMRASSMADHVVTAATRHATAWILAAAGAAAGVMGGLVAAPRVLQPSYAYTVGDFAATTLRAPYDVSVADDEATARRRNEAAAHTPPVARFDPGPGSGVPATISAVFSSARLAMATADAIRRPPDDEARLSSAARRRRQAARDREAERARQLAVQETLGRLEMQLGTALPPETRTVLAEGRFDQRHEEAVRAFLAEAYSRPVVRDLAWLRGVAERSRRAGEPPVVILRTSQSPAERVVPDAALLDDVSGAVARIDARARYLAPDLSPAERQALVTMATRLVVPDTLYDESATTERRARAAATVLPVTLHFRRNQLIVGEGREVTREVKLVLERLRQEGLPRAFLGRAAGSAALLWVLLAGVVWLPFRLDPSGRSLRDAGFTLATAVAGLGAFWVWLVLADSVSARMPGVPRVVLLLAFPVSAAPMLAGLVLKPRLTAGLSAVLALSSGMLTDLGVIYAAYALAVGLIAQQLVSECRQRSCVLRAGLTAGVVAAAGGFAMATALDTDQGPARWLAAALAGLIGSVGGAFVALAASRPAEWLFGFSTRLRLVELLSYDHPLLRRLMEQAPGTFQHSVAVGLLARQAADAIGADGLLVRVGALYHDVGKTEHPAYFTENQHGENPHDHLPPEVSARIIIGHVGQGVGLVRRHGVGEHIADFVREHQGTDALTMFLRRAQAQETNVDTSLYRYPGPRPRSRETAVVMLADKIEATARSTGATTHDQHREVVERTIRTLQATGQFDESPLTLQDLERLRVTFVDALGELNHHRVAYQVDASQAASGGAGPQVKT